MDIANVIFVNDRFCHFVFWRENDGKFHLVADVGIEDTASYPKDAVVVDKGIVRSKAFGFLIRLTAAVRMMDLVLGQRINVEGEMFVLNLPHDQFFRLRELTLIDVTSGWN